MNQYVEPTYFIDSDHPEIVSFAEKNSRPEQSDIEKSIQIYYAVRDGIRYNPYSIEPDAKTMKASSTLARGHGYCVAKAVLLAACLRSRGIKARLGLADVQNHLNTKRLKKLMGTDVFIYHGYTEIYLEGKWIKATPAFNLELCENFNVKPLEFDGRNDSIFHPFDNAGNLHMEYVRDHGVFADLPWDRILKDSMALYPAYFEDVKRRSKDFSSEARQENISQS